VPSYSARWITIAIGIELGSAHALSLGADSVACALGVGGLGVVTWYVGVPGNANNPVSHPNAPPPLLDDGWPSPA
jgi:hypothetical protein